MSGLEELGAERRNLVTASMAFIVFVLAGGRVSETTQLKLQFINVEFDRGGVLTWSAWALLGWFAFRFWQSTKAKTSGSVWHDISAVASGPKNPLVVDFLERRTGGKVEDVPDALVYGNFNCAKDPWEIGYSIVAKVTGPSNARRVLSTGSSREQKVDGLDGLWLRMRLRLAAAIRREAFVHFVAPYVFAGIAAALGLWRVIPWSEIPHRLQWSWPFWC